MRTQEDLSYRTGKMIVMSETGSDSESPISFEREDAEVELGNGDSLSERLEKLREERSEHLSAEEIQSELGLE